MQMLLRILIALAMTLSMGVLTSCGDGASSDLPSQENEDGNTDGDGDSTASEADEFFVKFSDDDLIYHQTRAGVFNSECSISLADATSSSNAIKCVFDVLEMDAYVQDLDLEYNVPNGMCDYVVAYPSWHWNYSVGEGPAAVSIVQTDGVALDPTDASECLAQDRSGTWTTCSANEEVQTSADGVGCIYDGTFNEGTGVNCCFGDYRRTETNISGSSTVSTVNDTTWNGTGQGACIGGGVQGGWGQFDESTLLPNGLITTIDDNGVNLSMPLGGNAGSFQTSFIYQSNFYETAADYLADYHAHTGFSTTSVTVTTPYAFNPIDDLDGSTSVNGISLEAQDSYLFVCADRAGEQEQQIEVYIREWNTYTEFIAFGTSGGVVDATNYKPHVTGTEGTDCNESNSWSDDACNDYTDFQDIVTNATGSQYDTSTPDATERASWFPQVDYE